MLEGILWGEDQLPPKAATEHFLVVGASGSGKTILINRLLFSLFQNWNSQINSNFRAVIYDPKQEVIPIIMGMIEERNFRLLLPDIPIEPTKDRVRILHPFDSRSSAWDMATDIDGPISARQVASLLIPKNKHSGDNSFFDDAIQDLLTGVMLTFINCVPNSGSWTFRDVVLAMLYEPYLRFILSLDKTRNGKPFPIVSRLVNSYLDGDPRTTANIRASINTRLSVYEPIAAVWEMARNEGKIFSIKKWIDTDEILIIGNDESARIALDSINQVLFKRLTEIVLNKKEISEEYRKSGQDLTWFFLDEVREAGLLDGLSRLLTKGRSKGVSVVLGFQDIEGLQDVYGEQVTGEITGQCQNVAVLQISNPTTSEWATNLFGKFLMQTTSSSRDRDQEGRTTLGKNFSEDDRPLVYSGDFIYLPETSPENGLTGYFRSKYRDRDKDGLRVELDWEANIKPYLPTKNKASNFEARPISQHYLHPWTREDWKRLGFSGEPPSWQAGSVSNNNPRPPDPQRPALRL